jgi:hypothetical protein
MPALITGRFVTAVDATARRELLLTFQGSDEAVPWSKQPSVFSAARSAGFNTAIVGSWHPYCKLLGNALSICSQHDDGEDANIIGSMREQAIQMVLPPRTYTRNWRRHIALYRGVLADAREIVRRPDMGLVLIHWPVPHFPPIYDRRSGHFSLTGSYLDNLALADQALGEVRREMETAGTWDNSIVIVTADHWWRPSLRNQLPASVDEEGAAYGSRRDLRVVFLIKMAGQKEGVTIQASFNTILLHDLILEMLARRITTAGQAVEWIQASPTAGWGASFIVERPLP